MNMTTTGHSACSLLRCGGNCSTRRPSCRNRIRQSQHRNQLWRQPIPPPSHKITTASERNLRPTTFTPLLGRHLGHCSWTGPNLNAILRAQLNCTRVVSPALNSCPQQQRTPSQRTTHARYAARIWTSPIPRVTALAERLQRLRSELTLLEAAPESRRQVLIAVETAADRLRQELAAMEAAVAALDAADQTARAQREANAARNYTRGRIGALSS